MLRRIRNNPIKISLQHLLPFKRTTNQFLWVLRLGSRSWSLVQDLHILVELDEVLLLLGLHQFLKLHEDGLALRRQAIQIVVDTLQDARMQIVLDQLLVQLDVLLWSLGRRQQLLLIVFGPLSQIVFHTQITHVLVHEFLPNLLVKGLEYLQVFLLVGYIQFLSIYVTVLGLQAFLSDWTLVIPFASIQAAVAGARQLLVIQENAIIRLL